MTGSTVRPGPPGARKPPGGFGALLDAVPGRQILGLTLVGVGIAGTLLPIVPGIPILLAGAAVLGPEHRLVRFFSARLKRWTSRRTDGPR